VSLAKKLADYIRNSSLFVYFREKKQSLDRAKCGLQHKKCFDLALLKVETAQTFGGVAIIFVQRVIINIAVLGAARPCLEGRI